MHNLPGANVCLEPSELPENTMQPFIPQKVSFGLDEQKESVSYLQGFYTAI